MHFFDMNPAALRKAKLYTIFTFPSPIGLKEKQINMLFKDINIIYFAIFSYFFNSQK